MIGTSKTQTLKRCVGFVMTKLACWFEYGDEDEIQLVQAGIQECEPTIMTRLFKYGGRIL